MPRRYVNQLVGGERVEEVFQVLQKQLRTTSGGAYYIHCLLGDKSGQIQGRLWQATEAIYDAFPLEGFLKIKGRIEPYQGNLQVIIEGMQAVPASRVDISEFLPHTDKDVEQMWQRTLAILRGVEDPFLLQLIKQFVTDEDFAAKFRRAPAAVQVHHAFVGGLLEHTLNVLEDVLLLAPRYPELNRDVLLTGAFLHDAGKTVEIASERALAYTDQGQLLGHIVQGALLVAAKARAAAEALGRDVPQELMDVLMHVIVSHHGVYEFGSPKLPATPEAIALHHLDNLDAKVHAFLKNIEADTNPESRWTGYVPALERRLYKWRPEAS